MGRLRVAVLVGSLRQETLTKKIASVLVELAPPSLECSLMEIGDLGLLSCSSPRPTLAAPRDAKTSWIHDAARTGCRCHEEG